MQRVLKIILIASAVFSLPDDLSCQISSGFDRQSCPNEKMELHVSTETLFTGETAGFKVYCTSAVFPGVEISSVAYIELVSPENTSVVRQQILLKHGTGEGVMSIPSNLSTGLYYLIAYTNWMKNFGEDCFFRKGIAVINPDQPYNDISEVAEKNMIPDNAVPIETTHDILKISTDKPVYPAREKVTLMIMAAAPDGKKITGDFSLSVSRKEPQLVFPVDNPDNKNDSAIFDEGFRMPDHNGIILSGTLSDQSGNAVPDALILLSEPGPGTEVVSCVTQSNGDFKFLLAPGTGEKDIILKLSGSDLKLSLDEPFWNGFRKIPDKLQFNITPEAIPFLREKFYFLQLQERFKKEYFKKVPLSAERRDSSVFYSMPYKTIITDNYIALDSLTEYFHELIPDVNFIRKRKEVEVSVIDPSSLTVLQEKPGVFLDGIPYDNYTEIADIPAGEIDRISILPAVYYYKSLTFGGIIDIHTKKSDFSSVKLLPDMVRFIYPMPDLCEWKFTAPDYSLKDPASSLPDFRYLLAWVPDIRINNDGMSSFQFFTGDLEGIYIIKVTGLSDDGKILHSEMEISVAKSSE
jgi:hypothetical protein